MAVIDLKDGDVKIIFNDDGFAIVRYQNNKIFGAMIDKTRKRGRVQSFYIHFDKLKEGTE